MYSILTKQMNAKFDWVFFFQQQEKVHLSNQEKLQLLHHHNQNQQILNGHIASTSSVSSATVVNEAGGGGGGGGGYFTHGHNHYTQERQLTHPHHLCLMCRQEFTSKAEFMFHVRGHFEGKVSDIATADVLARSLVDTSGLCTWAESKPNAFQADEGFFQDENMLKFWSFGCNIKVIVVKVGCNQTFWN